MDSLTHIVLGAAIGEAMLGKKIGKKAMLWGALVNSLPDIDVIATFFTDPVNALIIHRGITHSILFALLMAPLLAFCFIKIYPKYQLSLNYCLLFFLVTILAHSAIDVQTSYGTGLLEPFSHQRFSTNSIFVADPLFTLPLLISFIVLLILNKKSRVRRKINRSALYLSFAYLIFTFINKSNVNYTVKKEFDNQSIFYSDYIATPAPLNNLLWNVIAKVDSGYYTGYYSILDTKKNISFTFISQNEQWIEPSKNDPSIEKLKFFSHGFYTLTKNDSGELCFNDIRFGQAAGWAKADSRFVFSYQLKNVAHNVEILKRTDFEISWKEALSSLWKRMMGS